MISLRAESRLRPLALSVMGHALVLGALLFSFSRWKSPLAPTRFLIEVQNLPAGEMITSSRGTKPSVRGTRPSGIDLRPDFMKGDALFVKPSSAEAAGESTSESARLSSELLNTNPKVAGAFDQLAAQINYSLEYPMLLARNGIQGEAVLDLYFDANGEVDEARSHFTGGNRSLRGLLVRASRQGIVKWYRGDGARLAKEQFKNQHFRADFSISYTLTDASRVDRDGEGAYRFVRRHNRSVCANPMGVDLACLAVKGYGAIRDAFTNEDRVKLALLQDTLDRNDEMGLQGVRQQIRGG